MSHGADSKKSIIYALAANTAIAIAKFFAAWITKSGSMLAEAIHSLVDTSNQGLLLFGLKQSKTPPSLDHPLGEGKSIYFWSFIVALMLFSMGGLFSIYEGIHKLQSPEPLTNPLIAIGVLLFAIVAEGLSLAGCIREVNKVRGDQSILKWFKESRQSELLIVFGEDVAALFGLSFALIAVVLTMVTGNPLFDAIGTLVIGGLLIVIAFFLGVEVKDLLIGQGVEPEIRERMIQFLENQQAIVKVFNILTLQMGPDVVVAIKAKMNEEQTASEMVDQINAIEKLFKSEFSQVRWLFFEPDKQD